MLLLRSASIAQAQTNVSLMLLAPMLREQWQQMCRIFAGHDSENMLDSYRSIFTPHISASEGPSLQVRARQHLLISLAGHQCVCACVCNRIRAQAQIF